jgi:hypothetical protein
LTEEEFDTREEAETALLWYPGGVIYEVTDDDRRLVP